MRNVLLIFLLVCTNFLFAQTDNLYKYYNELAKLNQYNGNVLVANKNKIIFQQTFNINELPDSFKVQGNSKFIIASVSKVFIKVAILKLAEQHKLTLTDTIGKFISNLPKGNKITIEHLLLHKSGLPRELSNYEKYNLLSLNQIIELAKKEKLLFEPNTNVAYSNVGYFLLHKIIDTLSGSGYFNFMQKEIFDKLKLKNTFEYNNAKSKTDFVYGFSNETGAIEPAEVQTINQFETGNIITTLEDLYVFSKAISNHKFLSQTSRAFLFSNDNAIIQAGGRQGYRAYFHCNAKLNITYILLSNQSNIPFDDIVKQTNNILENKPFVFPIKTERKEMILPNDTLLKYIGTYISTEHNLNFTIQINNNHLVVKETDGNETVLYAETNNSFFDHPKSKETYSFISNEMGEVIAFQILTNGIKVTLNKK